MRAWRIYGPGDMRLDEVPIPKPKPNWVLVKVKVVQPSVTEVVAFNHIGGSAVSRRGVLPLQLFGHEFSGEVVEVGEGVTSLKKGSRVATGDARVPCGKCMSCRSGQEEWCESRIAIGDEAVPGCFAEYVVLPARNLLEIPHTVSDSEAACIQTLTACIGFVDVAQIALGDSVVVLGQGAIGLGIMQIARVSGAGRLITTARRQISLELSRRLGSDDVINADETDPVKVIRELTRGSGADIVFETAGGSTGVGLAGFETFKQALQVVRRMGKIVSTAFYEGNLELNPALLRWKKFVMGGVASRKTMEHLVHLLGTKRIQVEPTITHRLKGLEAVPEAFEITGNKRKYDAVNPAQVIVS